MILVRLNGSSGLLCDGVPPHKKIKEVHGLLFINQKHLSKAGTTSITLCFIQRCYAVWDNIPATTLITTFVCNKFIPICKFVIFVFTDISYLMRYLVPRIACDEYKMLFTHV